MRFLVISDIHANLCAFEAVLTEAEGQYDKIWFLGDLVGYGPDPNECVDLLREHEHLALSGNHDWAVLERLDVYSFNADARAAIGWTQNVLSEANRTYLAALPSKVEEEEHFTLAHASPRHPVWEYILDAGTASANFDHFDTRYCFVGHTHTPAIFQADPANGAAFRSPRHSEPLPLRDKRLIINPGSVGQPRDSDPRAAYAILDTEMMTVQHHRVEYPVAVTQERMRRLGMSYRLIVRLDYGW